jgi:hypothetical protein
MALRRLSTRFGLCSKALQAAAKVHNFIIHSESVHIGQPLELNANKQRDTELVATGMLLLLPIGKTGFIAVDYAGKE